MQIVNDLFRFLWSFAFWRLISRNYSRFLFSTAYKCMYLNIELLINSFIKRNGEDLATFQPILFLLQKVKKKFITFTCFKTFKLPFLCSSLFFL